MNQTRRALLASLLVAACVCLGFALSAVPNVELVTIAVFVSGFLLGPGYGALVGAASAALFSVFNPLGTALPPLVIAQALAQSVVGLSGALVGPLFVRLRNRPLAMALSGVAGLALTGLYDVLTSAGAYVTVVGEKTLESLARFVAAGILFVGVHLAWNTGVFAVVLVPILRVLGRYRRELDTR